MDSSSSFSRLPKVHLTINHDKTQEIAKRMRQKSIGVPIQDRRYRFKTYPKCFIGSEAVDWLVKTLNISREEAVSFGQSLVDMHLFHHVCDTDMQRKGFLDGYYFYRFVEDEYPNCLNCNRMCKTDVLDPLKVVQQLLEDALALVAPLATQQKTFDTEIASIRKSDEYHKFANDVDIRDFSEHDKLIFWVNVYNLLSIHISIEKGIPPSWKNYFTEATYLIQMNNYCLDDIEHGILRANSPHPGILAFGKKRLGDSDDRVLFVMEQTDPRIHFMLACCTKSSPPIPVLERGKIEETLSLIANNYCCKNVFIYEDTIFLPKVMNWYKTDFGKTDDEIFSYILPFLTAQQKMAMTKGASIKYKDNYDWTFSFPIKLDYKSLTPQ